MRAVRRAFGGWFYNDWHGKNRYTPVDADKRGPAGRGIALAYEHVTNQISAVRDTLPEPNPGFSAKGKLAVLATFDPTRVLYNALVPFVVATLEYFFSETFRILLRYDAGAQKKLREQTRKVELVDLLAVAEADKRVEDVVADWYSFQNIASIQSAFKEWFGIDFRRLLRRRRKVGASIAYLDERLERLISRRHGIVHRFELDGELSREQIDQLLATAVLLIDTLASHLERERHIVIFEPGMHRPRSVVSRPAIRVAEP